MNETYSKKVSREVELKNQLNEKAAERADALEGVRKNAVVNHAAARTKAAVKAAENGRHAREEIARLRAAKLMAEKNIEKACEQRICLAKREAKVALKNLEELFNSQRDDVEILLRSKNQPVEEEQLRTIEEANELEKAAVADIEKTHAVDCAPLLKELQEIEAKRKEKAAKAKVEIEAAKVKVEVVDGAG